MSDSLSGSQAQPPAAPNPMLTAMASAHGQARARFGQTREATGNAQLVRSALDSLLERGDTVRPEDVIDEAGRVVAGGIDPMQMATLLADMPEGGPALQGWLQAHEQQFAQQQAQLAQAHEAARHQLGTSAIRMLAAHVVHSGHVVPPPQATQSVASNPLEAQ